MLSRTTWKLTYWPTHTKSGYVTACRATEVSVGWRPGWPMPSCRPELTNALLVAYRRAVDKGLAEWPEGWEWAAGEMPGPTEYSYNADNFIWLGWQNKESWRPCHWPIENLPDTAAESRRRAAALGLCEAEQTNTELPRDCYNCGNWCPVFSYKAEMRGTSIEVKDGDSRCGMWKPVSDRPPQPFQVGDWVVYHRVPTDLAGCHRSYRVCEVGFRDGCWQWKSAISAWRDCADYRVVARDYKP